jgi:hypothetical protein
MCLCVLNRKLQTRKLLISGILGSTGVCTQGLMLAGLVLHHLSHSAALFCFSCFFRYDHVFLLTVLLPMPSQ